MQRISGKDVEARLPSGRRILFETVNLNLNDGIAATRDQGYPNGWVGGEVSGDGDMEISTEMMLVLNEEAAQAGTWESIPAFDLTLYAKSGDLELDVRVHGVKLHFPQFAVDGKGGDKLMHTVNFEVTSPDFVHINGIPLANRL